MTIIKTEHLTGAQLDWAVAKAEGIATKGLAAHSC